MPLPDYWAQGTRSVALVGLGAVRRERAGRIRPEHAFFTTIVVQCYHQFSGLGCTAGLDVEDGIRKRPRCRRDGPVSPPWARFWGFRRDVRPHPRDRSAGALAREARAQRHGIAPDRFDTASPEDDDLDHTFGEGVRVTTRYSRPRTAARSSLTKKNPTLPGEAAIALS